MSRACSGRAQSARFARARTEPPRRIAALVASLPWPLQNRTKLAHSPRHPWRPTAPLAEHLAARQRRQRAPAMVGAAQATRARQLPM